MECSVFRLITCSLYIGEQLCSTVNGFIVFLKEIPGVALMIFCKTKRQCSGRSVGAPGMHPPTARNVFIFVPFFWKLSQNCMSPPGGSTPPPMRNPESAPVL